MQTVAMRMRFIKVDCNLLITNVLIFKHFLNHTLCHTFSSSTPKKRETLGKRGLFYLLEAGF